MIATLHIRCPAVGLERKQKHRSEGCRGNDLVRGPGCTWHRKVLEPVKWPDRRCKGGLLPTGRRFQVVQQMTLEDVSALREVRRRSKREGGFWGNQDSESVELMDLTGTASKLEA